MKSNMGYGDKAVRLITAFVIATLYMLNIISGTAAIILLIVAAALIITSYFNFCPIYHLLEISTKKTNKRKNNT